MRVTGEGDHRRGGVLSGTARGRTALGGILRAMAAGSLAALTAAALGSAAAARLGPLTTRGTVTPAGLEGLVMGAATGVGAVAATLLALGCLLLAASLAAQGAGRAARGLERLATALTPRVLRRALVLGVGGLLVAGPAAAAAGEDPPDGTALDLGWSVSAAAPSLTTTPPAPPSPGATTGSVASAEPAAAAGEPTSPVTAGPASPAVPAPSAGPGLAAGPAITAPAPSSAVGAPPDATATHVVVPGDSLWSIAEARLGAGAADADVAAQWPRWYAANAAVIGPDPDLVLPGQELVAPALTPSHEEQP